MRRWRRRLASTPSSLVGLLATSGTIESGVYAEAAERAGVKIIVPDAAHQLLVMEAIYGATGGKAGFTEGKCREDLRKAIIHLNHVYFEKRSFSSSGSRMSLTQRRSAMTKG